MKILISVVSVEEAKIALKVNPDIIDIKNPDEGSLGAQFPWILKDIVEELKGSEVLSSATLGDLAYKPGTASLAAFGAASCGVDYIKAGLFGTKNYNEALNLMTSVVNSVRMVNMKTFVVAAGYADYNRFGGIPYKILARVAKNSGADVVMVDTAIKDGKNLFDAMNSDEIRDFIHLAHNNGLQVALAGSIKREHLDLLLQLNPDIIGVRGAVCENDDRTNKLSGIKIKEFMTYSMSHILL
jgi:uncharacterized protein (UPF0264 family)